MKTIVVYRSSTGFTEKYARWIAEDLNCEAKEQKKIKADELAGYDLVVYGAPIMAGMVSGYEKIRAMEPTELIVFAVGMTVPGEAFEDLVCTQNKLEKEKFFYFEGGYAPERLGFFQRLLMGMIRKSIEKKPEKTAEDLHMLESFKGSDRTDRGAIAPLVALCREKDTAR